MDWLRSKFTSQTALSIPSQSTIHQKLPWVRELYYLGRDRSFEKQSVNRVKICKRPVSSLPGIPLHTDLYFYQKGWNKPKLQVLFTSYHGSEGRVDLSKVKAKDVNLQFYKKCEKRNLKPRDLTNLKIIEKALFLSDQKYNHFTNNCNHSAEMLIKQLS